MTANPGTTWADRTMTGIGGRLHFFLAALPLAALVLMPAPHPSVWRSLADGRRLATGKGFPDHSVGTVLGNDEAYVQSTWLADWTAYKLFQIFGALGIWAARSAVAAVAFGAVWSCPPGCRPLQLLCWLLAAPALAAGIFDGAACVDLIAVSLLARIAVRGALVSLRLLILVVLLLQAVWANTSSIFALGPVLLGGRALGEFLDARIADPATSKPDGKRWLMVWAASVVGSLCSPFSLAGLRGSLWNLFAAYLMDVEGQWLVTGLYAPWRDPWWKIAALPCIVLLLAWFMALLRTGPAPRAGRFGVLSPTCLLVVMAAIDGRWLPVLAVWLAMTLPVLAGMETSVAAGSRGAGWHKHVRPACLGIAAAYLTIALLAGVGNPATRVRQWVLGESVPQRRIAWLSRSGVSGVCLPMDPVDAGWLMFATPQLRPVLDDRLECFGHAYKNYRRVCDDVAFERHDAYPRTDGTWGGWRTAQNQWDFEWVVVPSSRANAVGRLFRGKYWGPVYWDCEIVLFAERGHELAQRSLAWLSALESLADQDSMFHDLTLSRLILAPPDQRHDDPRQTLAAFGDTLPRPSHSEVATLANLALALNCKRLSQRMAAGQPK